MSNNYRLKKIGVKDLIIKLDTIFQTENINLFGVRPAFVYKDNHPTDEVQGYYYDIGVENGGKYLSVRIDGEKQVADEVLDWNSLHVEFEGLVIKVYSSGGYPQICASADKIKIL